MRRKAAWAAFVIVWLACGVGGEGLTLRYFQAKYPESACSNYRQDLGMSVATVWMGPIDLFASLCYTGFGEHGWSLARPKGCTEAVSR
jgi:hypothetical protein